MTFRRRAVAVISTRMTDLSGPAHPVVDETTGDTHRRWDVGQVIGREPGRLGDLRLLADDVTGRVPGAVADHKRVRKRPRLAPEVLEVANFDANLLANLPNHCLLEVLAGLDKARKAGEHRASKVHVCLLYTSPSPRDRQKSRMPSSA